MKNKYLLIAILLVSLKNVKNYQKINKGFFDNSPDFEGFNVTLTNKAEFKLHFLLNTNNVGEAESSVKYKEDVVFITYYDKGNKGLESFVGGLDEISKDIIPLLEKAIGIYESGKLRQKEEEETKYNVPYGYSKIKGGKIVLDKDEANLVSNIFKTYIRLRSMKKTVTVLAGAGVMDRKGRNIYIGTISDILHDERYIDKEYTKIATVIPTSIFYKAQDTLRRGVERAVYSGIKDKNK